MYDIKTDYIFFNNSGVYEEIMDYNQTMTEWLGRNWSDYLIPGDFQSLGFQFDLVNDTHFEEGDFVFVLMPNESYPTIDNSTHYVVNFREHLYSSYTTTRNTTVYLYHDTRLIIATPFSNRTSPYQEFPVGVFMDYPFHEGRSSYSRDNDDPNLIKLLIFYNGNDTVNISKTLLFENWRIYTMDGNEGFTPVHLEWSLVFLVLAGRRIRRKKHFHFFR